VNAALSQTTPTSPTSLKRPAPEDGEIADTNTTITTPAEQKPAESILGRIQGAAGAGAGAGTGPRVLKRPRAAVTRGGAARRPSGPGQGGAGGGAGGGGGAGDGAGGTGGA